MKKEIAIFGVATFAVLGLCFSAQANARPTNEEMEEKRAERADDKAEKFENRGQGQDRGQGQGQGGQGQLMKDSRGEMKEEREEMKNVRKERNCENIEKRMETRIKRYENKQAQHRNVFGGLLTRMEALVVKFKAESLDTSKLEAALIVLRQKVGALETAHQTFISGLKETETIACGESEENFRGKLGEARKMTTEVRSGITEIREHYKNVVRVEILALRDQLEETDEVEENEEDEREEEQEQR